MLMFILVVMVEVNSLNLLAFMLEEKKLRINRRGPFYFNCY